MASSARVIASHPAVGSTSCKARGHVEFADADYRRLADHGIRCARDGFSWPRVECVPGRRDFASVVPLVRAARRHGVRVVWDLLHFGWPDDLDPFQPVFVDRFAALARDFARLLADEGDAAPWISPVNEISFLAWGGADVACINPFERGRGFELKCQLVRAIIAAVEAVRDVQRDTRIVVHDPAFHVTSAIDGADDEAVEHNRLLQFQGCDLLTGRQWPQLGGRPDYVDVIGVNYYPWNQWTFETALHAGALVAPHDPRYRPLSAILVEWQQRYDKPTYVGETGCEGAGRAAWLRYVCDQVRIAKDRGTEIGGVCLYPIVDFPGWDDDRHCRNGLWGYADGDGRRAIDVPFGEELAFQQRLRADLARRSTHHEIGAALLHRENPSRFPNDPSMPGRRLSVDPSTSGTAQAAPILD